MLVCLSLETFKSSNNHPQPGIKTDRETFPTQSGTVRGHQRAGSARPGVFLALAVLKLSNFGKSTQRCLAIGRGETMDKHVQDSSTEQCQSPRSSYSRTSRHCVSHESRTCQPFVRAASSSTHQVSAQKCSVAVHGVDTYTVIPRSQDLATRCPAQMSLGWWSWSPPAGWAEADGQSLEA